MLGKSVKTWIVTPALYHPWLKGTRAPPYKLRHEIEHAQSIRDIADHEYTI